MPSLKRPFHHQSLDAEDYKDLLSFIQYIRYSKLNKSSIDTFNRLNTTISSTSSSNIKLGDDQEELPAALIQLLFMIFVFLSILFLCKCNKLMYFCRENVAISSNYHYFMRNKDGIVDVYDAYNEEKTYTLRDYISYLFYRLRSRLRRRSKQRNKLNNNNNNPRNKKRAKFQLDNSNSNQIKGSIRLNRHGGVRKRKQSQIIIRRRSAISGGPNQYLMKNNVLHANANCNNNNSNRPSVVSSNASISRKRQSNLNSSNSPIKKLSIANQSNMFVEDETNGMLLLNDERDFCVVHFQTKDDSV
jgi:hypothetical protein